jgi:hypothetical protein
LTSDKKVSTSSRRSAMSSRNTSAINTLCSGVIVGVRVARRVTYLKLHVKSVVLEHISSYMCKKYMTASERLGEFVVAMLSR